MTQYRLLAQRAFILFSTLIFNLALASANTTFNVAAQVVNTCTIQTPFNDVAFGIYDPKARTDTISPTQSFQFTCTNGAHAGISVSGGNLYDAANGLRQMTNPENPTGAKIKYNLYFSSPGNTTWGVIPRNTTIPITQTNGLQVTFLYRGIILYAKQSRLVRSGLFSDTLTITISY